MDITIFADGACSGNPGPGGWAFAIWKGNTAIGEPVIKMSGHSPQTTNNIMEMVAVREALRLLAYEPSPFVPGQLTLCCDSQLVLNGIFEWMDGWRENGWRKANKKPVANDVIWKEIDELVSEMRMQGWTLQPKHVRGHSGDYGNDLVDEYAVKASRGIVIDQAHQPRENDMAARPTPPAASIFWLIAHQRDHLTWDIENNSWKPAGENRNALIGNDRKLQFGDLPPNSKWEIDLENSDPNMIRNSGLAPVVLDQFLELRNKDLVGTKDLLILIKSHAQALGIR